MRSIILYIRKYVPVHIVSTRIVGSLIFIMKKRLAVLGRLGPQVHVVFFRVFVAEVSSFVHYQSCVKLVESDLSLPSLMASELSLADEDG